MGRLAPTLNPDGQIQLAAVGLQANDPAVIRVISVHINIGVWHGPAQGQNLHCHADSVLVLQHATSAKTERELGIRRLKRQLVEMRLDLGPSVLCSRVVEVEVLAFGHIGVIKG